MSEVAREGRNTPSGFLGVSIGIAEMSSDELLEPYEVLAIADAALYRAKEGGRNCVRLEEGTQAA